MSSITNKIFTFSSGKIIAAIIMLILTALLSRILSINDYGVYRQVWLIYLTISPIFALGIPASIMYFIPKMDFEEQRKAAFQSLYLLAILGFVMGIITFIFADNIAKVFNDKSLADLIRIFSLYPIFNMPLVIIETVYIIVNRVKAALVVTISNTLYLFFSNMIPLWLGFSLKVMFISIVIVSIIRFMMIVWYTSKIYKGLSFKFDYTFMLSQFKYSIPLGLSAILSIFILQIDKILIAILFTPDKFAIYFNGAFEVPMLTVITSSTMTILTVEFVKLVDQKEHKKLETIWNNSIKKLASIIYPIGFFLFVFADEFIILLFSDKYMASVVIFRIFLLLLLLRITQYGSILRAINKTKLILYCSLGTLIMKLIFSLLFINILGLIGPAIATVIAVYVLAIIQLFFICKYTELNFKTIFPWKNLLFIILACALASIATYIISHIFLGSLNLIIRLVITGSLYFVVYLYAIIYFKISSIEAISEDLGINRIKFNKIKFK